MRPDGSVAAPVRSITIVSGRAVVEAGAPPDAGRDDDGMEEAKGCDEATDAGLSL
jgi:hypothetical protein